MAPVMIEDSLLAILYLGTWSRHLSDFIDHPNICHSIKFTADTLCAEVHPLDTKVALDDRAGI